MDFKNSLLDLHRIIRFKGWKYAFRHIHHRAREKYYECKFGLASDGEVPLSKFGFNDPQLKEYSPISYQALRRVLLGLRLRPGQEVFVDFGAGKGRAVIMAAMLPFNRVIGVELSAELCALARANVQRALPHLRCRDVRIINIDARQFQLPHDASVIYFFNPFRGEVLRAVVDNIQTWLERLRKPLTIVFFNNDDFQAHIQGCSWIRRRQTYSFFPALPCGIYECRWPDEGAGPSLESKL